MKILSIILFIFLGVTAYAEELPKQPLHLRIKVAVETSSSLEFTSGPVKRTIRFRDADSPDNNLETMIFNVSKKIVRIDYPNSRTVTLLEAKKMYQSYLAAIKKYRGRKEIGADTILTLQLSKNSDDKLLMQFIESICPIGSSSVWIHYFESSPVHRDPIHIHKPRPPKN